MLNKIIQYSLHNRLVVMIASIALLLWGSYTAHKMEVDVFPDLNAPTVVVMTEAQGMAPEEVERMVTFPIETAVNGATDVKSVRSSSTTGFSVVWVQFDWGTNIYTARQIVSEKLSTLGDVLPSNVGQPTLGPQSSILGEMMIFGLTADSTSLQDLRTIADWTIRPRLLSTGGVAQVAVIGGDIKEYQILLDPARMKHYGISMDEVLTVVDNMNQNSTGGILYEYGNEYIVQGILATDNVEELGKGVVKTVDNIQKTDIMNSYLFKGEFVMIERRNIAVCIVLTLVTCGIYGIYWIVCLTNDVNTVSGDVNGTSGGMVVLLTIVTCGIYGIYWAYKQGEKLDFTKNNRGIPSSNSGVLYLILQIFGFGIIAYALMQNELNKLA